MDVAEHQIPLAHIFRELIYLSKLVNTQTSSLKLLN